MTRATSRPAQARATSRVTDADLYERGALTLLGSWEEYARATSDAAMRRSTGVAAAVFPGEPERTVYNNALLARDLATDARDNAIRAMEAAYATSVVTRFAAWVHESDEPMRTDLERRGHTLDQNTRAMGMALDGSLPPRPEVDTGTLRCADHVRTFELRPGLRSNADLSAFHLLVARLDGASAATAMAFDLGGDCGIYNVTTLEHAQRRGLGTALALSHLHGALARGCRTASLQSTVMAERMYAAVGFRDLGRIIEHVPRASWSRPSAGRCRSRPAPLSCLLLTE